MEESIYLKNYVMSNPKGRYYYHNPMKANKYFDKSFEKNVEKIMFEDKEFLSLKKEFFDMKQEYSKENFNIIIDEKIPYQFYMDELYNNGLCSDDYIKRRERYQYWKTKNYTPIINKVNQYWNIMFRTETRFLLWDFYKNDREYILDNYKNKNYIVLEKQLHF